MGRKSSSEQLLATAQSRPEKQTRKNPAEAGACSRRGSERGCGHPASVSTHLPHLCPGVLGRKLDHGFPAVLRAWHLKLSIHY